MINCCWGGNTVIGDDWFPNVIGNVCVRGWNGSKGGATTCDGAATPLLALMGGNTVGGNVAGGVTLCGAG